jgi:alkanesulfonate monooxygenase SsuD/methylene tetrahydromethanopterin reductase-like flavin-dependent oxidoreductase (luciferase family)
VTLRVGLTLPSFRDDPEPVIAVARAAEAAGLDGVYAFDHVFREGPDGRRPALECFALLGAVAAETARVHLGPLVARATLRPPATLAHSLDTVQRVSGGRLIAAIGAGDSESREENESYGLPFGTLPERIDALRAALVAARGRGYPVWVAGVHPRVRALVEVADGWNRWGGDAARFAAEASDVRARRPDAAITWAGLGVLASTDAAAAEKAQRLGARPGTIVGGPETVAASLHAYGDAGASWVIVGPVDSSDPDNAALLGEVAARLRAR